MRHFRSVWLLPTFVLAALAGLLTVGPLPASDAAGPDLLPMTVTNDSGRGEDVFLYLLGVDTESGQLGYLDASGTFAAWPQGSLPPSPAPDVSLAGPHTGETVTVNIPKGFSGRMYLSFGERLPFGLTPDGLVQPAPWSDSDPTRDILFDWSEFTYVDGGLYLNSSQVDMFSVPHMVTVTSSNGDIAQAGEVVENGRNAIIQQIEAEPGWSDLVVRRDDGTVLRVLSPGKASENGALSETYFDSYVDEAWAAYTDDVLTVQPFGYEPETVFYGRSDGETLRFTDGSGQEVAAIAKPSTRDVWGCDGALGAPNDQVVGPIARTLCAALHRSTLGVIHTQPGGSAVDFYQGEIANHYSRVIHQNMVDGRAYGFAFDDVQSQESLVYSPDPASAGVVLSPFGEPEPVPTTPESPTG